MAVAYGPAKIASKDAIQYSKEMSEGLYLAKVSPVDKITFPEAFNSSLTIKFSLRPYGSTRCLKKPKSKGIASFLLSVFLIAFSWIVVPTAFLGPIRAFKPLADSIT